MNFAIFSEGQVRGLAAAIVGRETAFLEKSVLGDWLIL